MNLKNDKFSLGIMRITSFLLLILFYFFSGVCISGEKEDELFLKEKYNSTESFKVKIAIINKFLQLKKEPLKLFNELIEFYSKENNYIVKIFLIQTIGELKLPNSILFLSKSKLEFDDSSPEVLSALNNEIIKFRRCFLTDSWVSGFDDELNPIMRSNILKIFGVLDTPQSFDLLKAGIEDKNVDVRKSALEMIKHSGKTELISDLIKLKEREDNSSIKEQIDGIIELIGKNLKQKQNMGLYNIQPFFKYSDLKGIVNKNSKFLSAENFKMSEGGLREGKEALDFGAASERTVMKTNLANIYNLKLEKVAEKIPFKKFEPILRDTVGGFIEECKKSLDSVENIYGMVAVKIDFKNDGQVNDFELLEKSIKDPIFLNCLLDCLKKHVFDKIPQEYQFINYKFSIPKPKATTTKITF